MKSLREDNKMKCDMILMNESVISFLIIISVQTAWGTFGNSLNRNCFEDCKRSANVQEMIF